MEQPPRVGDQGAAGAAFTAVAEHYDRLMQHVPYRRWVEYVLELIRRAGDSPQDVLDLACGTGRVGLEFERRGFNAVGVDISEDMVRQAQAKRYLYGARMPTCVMDARRLGLRPAFDLVVSLYDSLNYVLDPDELRDVFEEVSGALRPGGLFIFDLNTARALRMGLFNQSNRGSNEPLTYRWRSHWDAKTKICRVDMSFRWSQDGKEQAFEEVHYQRGYEVKEVCGLLAEAGLDDIGAYNAYTLRTPTRWATRAFFMARRKEADQT